MSPSPPDPLLDAAAALVARGEELSVRAVAQEAGVARGTVYRRFAGRAELVAALQASGRGEAPAELRERILDAVGVLLRQKGLSATTLDEVAVQAGVGVATVYRRFGGRRGLLEAFVAERSPRRLAASLAPEAGGEPEALLFQVARETLAFLREYGPLLSLSQSADPEAVALFTQVREGSTSVRAMVGAWLDRVAPDPSGRTARAFWGLVLGVSTGPPGDLDGDARFVVSTFLRGVSR